MKKFARRSLLLLGATVNHIANKIYQSQQEIRVRPYFRDNGDKTLRLDYNLDQQSVVFDCGGYEGQWASDIYAKYYCNIHIFEPVPSFAENIRKRFAKNQRIRINEFGLSGKTCMSRIFLSKDSSSIFKKVNNKNPADTLDIKLIRALDYFEENKIQTVDLIKINIEGGEYDLLEHLIETGFIGNIRNVQVQFHDFVPNAKQRMGTIQNKLSKTHDLTYQYLFVWENWRLKQKGCGEVDPHPLNCTGR